MTDQARYLRAAEEYCDWVGINPKEKLGFWPDAQTKSQHMAYELRDLDRRLRALGYVPKEEGWEP